MSFVDGRGLLKISAEFESFLVGGSIDQAPHESEQKETRLCSMAGIPFDVKEGGA